ncbi:MAG: hypothetical protein ACLRWN_08390 [Eisenbergiella sp.]|uniref:hypothetical protein n=1 Tax=unclassified Eisenbergiella TaxID=2652273 RepID=UPI0011C2377D|nr:hypothetical protein [Eisenbergiella sp. OF01-20]
MGMKENVFPLSVRIAEAVRYLQEEPGRFPLDAGGRAGIPRGRAVSKPPRTLCGRRAVSWRWQSGGLSKRQRFPVREECAGLLAARKEAEPPW